MSLPQVSGGAPLHTTGVPTSLGEGMHINNYKQTDCAHFPSIEDLDSGSKPHRPKRGGYFKKRLRLPRLRKVDLAPETSNGSDTSSVISSIVDTTSERLSRLVTIPKELYDIRDSTGKDGAMSMPRDTLYLYGSSGLEITPRKKDSRVRLVFHAKPFNDINLLVPDRMYDGNYRPPRKMNKGKYLPSLEKPAKVKDTPKQTNDEQNSYYIVGESSGTKYVSEKSVTSTKFSKPAFKDISSIPLCDVFRYKESMRRALAHGRPLGKSKETFGEKMLSSSTMTSDVQRDLEIDANESKSVVFPIIVNFNEVTSDEIEEELNFRKMKASTQGRPILRQIDENQSGLLKPKTGEDAATDQRKTHRRRMAPLKIKGRRSVQEAESGYETETDNARAPSETSMRELGHLTEGEDDDAGGSVVIESPPPSVASAAKEENETVQEDEKSVGTQYNETDFQHGSDDGEELIPLNAENEKSPGFPDVEIQPRDTSRPESAKTADDIQHSKNDDGEIKDDLNESELSDKIKSPCSPTKSEQVRLESVASSRVDDENVSVWKAATPSARLSPICPDDIDISESDNKVENAGDGAPEDANAQREDAHVRRTGSKNASPVQSETEQENDERNRPDSPQSKAEVPNSAKSQSEKQQKHEQRTSLRRPRSLPNMQDKPLDETATKSKSSPSVTPRKAEAAGKTNGVTVVNGPFVFLPVSLKSIGNINELSKRVTVIDTEQYDKFRNERVYNERENGETSDEDLAEPANDAGDGVEIVHSRAPIANPESTKMMRRDVRTVPDKKLVKSTLGDRPRAANLKARGVDQK